MMALATYCDGNYVHTERMYYISILLECLAFSSACLNPVIYVIISQQFRDNFKRLVVCGLCRWSTTQSVSDGGVDQSATAVDEQTVKYRSDKVVLAL